MSSCHLSPRSPVPVHFPRVLYQLSPQHWLCAFRVTCSEVLAYLCCAPPCPCPTHCLQDLWHHPTPAHSLHSSLQRSGRAAGAGTGVGAGWGVRQSSGLLSEGAGSQQQHPDGEVLAEGTVRVCDSLRPLHCLGVLPQPAVHPRDASVTAGHKREFAGSESLHGPFS